MDVFNWTTSEQFYVGSRMTSRRIITFNAEYKKCEILILGGSEGSGSQNPADIPCRDIKARNLVSNSTWWHGPLYLQKPQCEWPKDPEVSSLDKTALIETIKKPPTVIHSIVSIRRLK